MTDVCLDRDLSTKKDTRVLECLEYPSQHTPASLSGGRSLLWAGWVPVLQQLNPTGMSC